MAKKVDGRANNGGARKGAGAPKKEVSEHAKNLIKKAVRILYNEDSDDEAQVKFLTDFAKTTRGQQFVAEHLFGKAPEKIQYEDVSQELSIDEKKKIIDELKKKL